MSTGFGPLGSSSRRRWPGFRFFAVSLAAAAVFSAAATTSLARGNLAERSSEPSATLHSSTGAGSSPTPADDAAAEAPLDAVAEPEAPSEAAAAPPKSKVYEPELLPFAAGPPIEGPTVTRKAVDVPTSGDEQIEAWLAAAGWPPYLRAEAKRVAWCESRWNPKTVNANQMARGLFQIWQDMRPRAWGWFFVFGYDPNDWSDPVKNAEIALFVYQWDLMSGHQPWAQWECKP